MAVVKTTERKIKTQKGLLSSIYYITNDKKTFAVNFSDGEEYIGATFATASFRRNGVKKSKREILAHHYIQSFAPNERITFEEAHSAGLELAEKIAPNYKCLVATHTDREHIHNHLIINAFSSLGNYKWHDNKETLKNVRNISNEISREHGWSVIEEPLNTALDNQTFRAATRGKSWKVDLTKILDEAVSTCKDKLEFFVFMNSRGFKISERGSDYNFSPKDDNEKNYKVRSSTLAKQFGEKYRRENLDKAMGLLTPIKNKSEPKKAIRKKSETKILDEWQRYEKYFFKEKSKTEKFENVNFLQSRFETQDEFTKFLEWVKQRLEVYKTSQNKITFGNIEREELEKANGENLNSKIDLLQIVKLPQADFFFSANIDTETKNTSVLIKRYNSEKLKNLVGDFTDLKELAKIISADEEKQKLEIENRKQTSKNSNEEIDKAKNFRINDEIKKQSQTLGVKPCYKVLTQEQFSQLKNAGIKFAVFSRNDGKFNTVFLKTDEPKINSVLTNLIK